MHKKLQVIWVVANIQIRCLIKNVGQIGKRIKVTFLGGLDDAKHNCASFGAPGCICEKKVFAVNYKGFDGALSKIVENFQSAIQQR